MTHGLSRQPDLYALPACLARPLARGMLSEAQAAAALLLAAYRGPGPAEDIGAVYRILQHLLGQHCARETLRRDLARQAIRQRLRPMLARRAAWVDLMDAALAADAGGALTEPEVIAAVREAAYWALPQAPRAVRHVR